MSLTFTMDSTVPDWLTNVFLVLVNTFLAGFLFIVATIIILCVFRNHSARLRHYIWIASFIILFSLPLMIALSGGMAEHVTPNILAEIPYLPSQFVPAKETSVVDNSVSVTSEFIIASVLIWFFGFVYFFGKEIRKIFKLGKLVRSAEDLKLPSCSTLERVKRRLAMRQRIRAVVSCEIPVPILYGVLRPTVVLPESAHGWSSSKLQSVLIHEFMHAKRRDNIWGLLTHLVCALCWCNPVIWKAARRMNHDRELACDELVIEAGIISTEYAGHILDLAEDIHRIVALPVSLPSMNSAVSLKKRIKSILGCRNKRRSEATERIVLITMSLFLITLSLLIQPYRIVGNITAEDASAELYSNVNSALSHFDAWQEGETLEEFVDNFGESAGDFFGRLAGRFFDRIDRKVIRNLVVIE